jgi:hypothetical protein
MPRAYCKPEQEQIEIEELRTHCPFAEACIPDDLLLRLIRESNPARVRVAMKLTHEFYRRVGGALTHSSIRKRLIQAVAYLEQPPLTPTF